MKRLFLFFILMLLSSCVISFKTVMREKSSNGKFELLIKERPHFDPPAQNIYLKDSIMNKKYLLRKLVEDVEEARIVKWNNDSTLVGVQIITLDSSYIYVYDVNKRVEVARVEISEKMIDNFIIKDGKRILVEYLPKNDEEIEPREFNFLL